MAENRRFMNFFSSYRPRPRPPRCRLASSAVTWVFLRSGSTNWTTAFVSSVYNGWFSVKQSYFDRIFQNFLLKHNLYVICDRTDILLTNSSDSFTDFVTTNLLLIVSTRWKYINQLRRFVVTENSWNHLMHSIFIYFLKVMYFKMVFLKKQILTRNV